MELLDGLREMSVLSVSLRLVLAMLFGGLIGLERAQKRRAAGMRTYMIVCTGAALAMLIGQYEAVMMSGQWADLAEDTGARADVCRMAAQVINGIGFLGAGIIMVTEQREVTGLTTAAGLWASACFGIAVGAAFYEVLPVGALILFLTIRGFPLLERGAMLRSRHMKFFVEFTSLGAIGEIIACLKERDIRIDQVILERSRGKRTLKQPNAVFFVLLKRRTCHGEILETIEKLDFVTVAHEL